MSTAEQARALLQTNSHPGDAVFSQKYFKTGPGEYGEGDRFIGVRVPKVRAIAAQLKKMPLTQIQSLLSSAIHEERLLALILLTLQFKTADEAKKAVLYQFYLDHTQFINNWDLVDVSAYKIVGPHLINKPKNDIYQLAQSNSLWERRIAIMSTLAFIKQDQFEDTFALSTLLLDDSNDLIHKAVGWMLREVGKRNRPIAEQFLQQHYRAMPRTMLRYAIEKFPPSLRQSYLEGSA